MKRFLLSLLACPLTGEPVDVVSFVSAVETGPGGEQVEDVSQGVLVAASGTAYPVIDGVPRLIEGALDLYPAFRRQFAAVLARALPQPEVAFRPPSDEFRKLMLPTLERFEQEWSLHDVEGQTWGFDQPTRLTHFLRYVGLPAEALRDKVILDAGAGTGQLTSTYATLGGHSVGVDLSPAVARGWALRQRMAGQHHTRVHLVQGDLMRPPFKPGAFDVVHSSGVLHHTPSTRRAFASTAKLVKAGGVLAVWLYKSTLDTRLPLLPGAPVGVRVSALRRVTPRLPPPVLYGLLYAYAGGFQVAYKLNQLLRGRPHTQTTRERVTSLFDTLAPPYVWMHTPAEVAAWFEEEGYGDVRDTSLPDDTEGFNVRGVRQEAAGR